MDNRITYGVSFNVESDEDMLLVSIIEAIKKDHGLNNSGALRYIVAHMSKCNGKSAMLFDKVMNIERMLKQGVVTRQTEEGPTSEAEEAEEQLLTAGMSREALIALKTKVAKPGMRLE